MSLSEVESGPDRPSFHRDPSLNKELDCYCWRVWSLRYRVLSGCLELPPLRAIRGLKCVPHGRERLLY